MSYKNVQETKKTNGLNQFMLNISENKHFHLQQWCAKWSATPQSRRRKTSGKVSQYFCEIFSSLCKW